MRNDERVLCSVFVIGLVVLIAGVLFAVTHPGTGGASNYDTSNDDATMSIIFMFSASQM